MCSSLKDKVSLFTGKQQRFLLENATIMRFAPKPAAKAAKESDDEEPEVKKEQVPKGANDMEDMMARCRAFVREKNSIPTKGEEDGEAGSAVADAAAALD